jgi:hypothetical protein
VSRARATPHPAALRGAPVQPIPEAIPVADHRKHPGPPGVEGIGFAVDARQLEAIGPRLLRMVRQVGSAMGAA